MQQKAHPLTLVLNNWEVYVYQNRLACNLQEP